ncbi:phosphodiesterase [Streptomyces sp. NPDC126499]|uniref:phosphodiesterase n=1 Tax=Streptomyces sp. NPDC126499 TaxID=3155314 RepID=UPI00332B2B94
MAIRPETGRLRPAALDAVSRLVERTAARRSAPALHPHGITCHATLRIRTSAGPPPSPWGVPWLDRNAEYPVRMRWSRALGLPGRLPDALGIALRVADAGGPGHPLDLLFTSSGSGSRSRHLPLPRLGALAGPYSSLLSYRVGGRTALLTLWPDTARTGLPADLEGLRRALAAGPVVLTLCASEPGRPALWPLGTLTTGAPSAPVLQETEAYDPYRHRLPDLHPTARLSRLREAAYTASRAGRGAAVAFLGDEAATDEAGIDGAGTGRQQGV